MSKKSSDNQVSNMDLYNLYSAGQRVTRGRIAQISQGSESNVNVAKPSKKQKKQKSHGLDQTKKILPDEQPHKKVKTECLEKSHQPTIDKPNFLAEQFYEQLPYATLSRATLIGALVKVVWDVGSVSKARTGKLLQIGDQEAVIEPHDDFDGTSPLTLSQPSIVALLLCTGLTQTSLKGNGWIIICFQMLMRRPREVVQVEDEFNNSEEADCYQLHSLLNMNVTDLGWLYGTNQYLNLNHMIVKQSRTSQLTYKVEESQSRLLGSMIVTYNEWVQATDNVVLRLEDADKLHRIIKVGDELAVVLRVVGDQNRQLQFLIRTLDGRNMWVNYSRTIRTSNLLPELCIENLRLTDTHIDPTDLLVNYLMPQRKHFSSYYKKEFIDTRKQRCLLCRMILSNLLYHQCLVCQATVHQNCYPRSMEKGRFYGPAWVCQGCQACSICWCLQAQSPLVKCVECSARFHVQCGFEQGSPSATHQYCPQCIKCQWCLKALKSLRYNLFGGELLCSDCEEVKNKKQYCLVCKTVWANNEDEWEKEYIQCVSADCEMWVHKDCDVVLRNQPTLFKLYSKEQSRVYRCPRCREHIRNLIFADTIRFLSYFDVDKSFWMIDTANTKYLEVIETPMDFVTLYLKNQQGEYQKSSNPHRLLMNDIKLILDNCLQYNLPNTRIHRRALLLQALYNIILPILKQKLFDLEEFTIIEYSEKQLGLVTLMQQIMRDCAKYFLDEAFHQCDNQVTILGSPWEAVWERQTLAFSAALSVPQPAPETRLIVAFERRINPTLDLADKDEPLIKFSYREFANHLLQSQITIKVNGIKGLLARTRVQPHPYLQYLLNDQVRSQTARSEVNGISSQMDIEPAVSFFEVAAQPSFETELQTFFNKILASDISKVKVQPLQTRIPAELITEFACQSCGGLEWKHNLLFCANCGDSHHFFCQIANPHLAPQRVVQAHLSNEQKQWMCLRCMSCAICKRGNYRPTDLICSFCNLFCHFRCIFPQFQVFPDPIDSWRCPGCFQCEKCKTKVYIDDKQLQLTQARDNDENTSNDPLCIELFQSFVYCLFCGMVQAQKSRFCDICQEYIYMDTEKEIVYPTTGKAAFKLTFRPEFWELLKIEGTYFKAFSEDISNRCARQNRQTLTYLVKEQLREGQHQCKKCLKRYHDKCLRNENRQLSDHGLCGDCQLDYSEVLFKYERCKQEQVRTQYQERKLKQLQPYLVCLLEIMQNNRTTRKRLFAPQRTASQWPVLSDDQKSVILENLDTFEQLINQFQSNYSILESIKIDIFKDRHVKDDFLDRLILFWSLKHGSLECPECITANRERDIALTYMVPDDSWDHYIWRVLRTNHSRYLTFQFVNGYGTFANKLFRIGYFPAYDSLSNILSELQCTFIQHIRQEPNYQYMENEYYLAQQDIINYSPVQLFSYEFQEWATKSIRHGCGMQFREYQRTKPSICLASGTHQLFDRPLQTMINQLHMMYREEQINEFFKQIVTSTKQMSIVVLEMREVYNTAMAELSQKREAELPTNTVKTPTPVDQAQQALDKVSSMIAVAADQQTVDSLIGSPLDATLCQICLVPGHRQISGRLLYCDGDRWAHTNCCIWSAEVKEKVCEQTISGVMQVLRNSKQAVVKCHVCNQNGASIPCLSSNCKKRFHFQCAYRKNYIFLSSKKVVCSSCMQDAQAYCVDQIGNNQSERTKTSLIKTLLQEILSSHVVNDFTCLRRINVVNSQKVEVRTSNEPTYARFGNTVLLELIQSTNRPLFKSLKILVNRLQPDQVHKFVQLTFIDGEYKLYYREFTRPALGNFIAQFSEDASKSFGKRPHVIINKIFETCDNYPLRSYQQLQQILHDKRFYPNQLGELTTYEDCIGTILLLTTPYVRQKLQERSATEQATPQCDIVNHYFQWFYVDDTLEEHPQQQRLQHLQWMVAHTVLRKPVNVTLQQKHPSLLDFKPKSVSKIPTLSPLKLAISPSLPAQQKVVMDRFTLSGELTPADILQETDMQLENSARSVNEGEKLKEIERVLKQEYQLIEQSKKRRITLYVGPSRIHKYGLFAKQKIKPNELIIEYTGEIIRNSLADQREHVYIENGFGDCYMFRATKEKVIDATFVGSQARYLNHSCDPNCASSIIEFNGQPKILIYAKRDIQSNEELTYDYQFEVEANKIQCFCGAKNCLGRLN